MINNSTLKTLPGKPRLWLLRQFDEKELVEAYKWLAKTFRFWWKPWKWDLLLLGIKGRYQIRKELKRRIDHLDVDLI